MQTPFFLRGHTPQGLEGPRSHCGVCSEAPRVIYVSVLNHIVNASTYLCVINGLRYLALLVFTQAVLSQVTLPCALKHHEALCCPALAILVPVMPRDQPNGAKLREPPASKRLHEPTRTWRPTSPAVMPQTGLHNTPLSAKRASQRARPATDGSRQASQASELLLLLLLLNPHSFSARPIVAIRLPI